MINLIFFLALSLLSIASVNANDDKATKLFSEIVLYAELANAIYEDKNVLQQVVGEHQLSLNAVNNVPVVEVSYALLTDTAKKLNIVVVRGTANVENAIVDMDLKLIADKQTDIRLHKGFLQAATPIFQELQVSLNKDYKVQLTGHSLGGAVAVILAMQLQSAGFGVDKVVTFGQPKVTNVEGAKKYKGLNLLRIVRPKDLVPIVPPVDPLELKSLDIYWHLGQEILLTKSNSYAELEGIKSMLRSVDFVTTVPNQENLESHKMTGYLEMVKQNRLEVVKVDYKSSFNPLSLFGSDN